MAPSSAVFGNRPMWKRKLVSFRRSLRKPRPQTSLLLHLPIEIMHLILDLLNAPYLPMIPKHKTQWPLLNVALTCRSLWILARQYIPREVHICAQCQPFPTRLYLFLRSVSMDKTYAENVRKLVFLKPPKAELEQISVPTGDIRRLLECLAKLNVLDLRGLPHSAVRPILFSGPLPLKASLHKLDIPGGLTVCETAELLSFPAMRKWRFWKLDDFACYNEFPDVDHIGLRALTFEDCQIGMPLFSNTISRCRDLRELECNLPFHTPIERVYSDNNSVAISHTFSALGLQAILSHCSETLTRLSLHNVNQTWNSHDGTRLDLSGFHNLKNIALSALCMFGPLSHRISRDGFYKLLPRAVEMLSLGFSQTIRLFHSGPDSQVITEGEKQFLSHDVTWTDFYWVLELALHQRARLPHLHSVQISESVWPPIMPIEGFYYWFQPSWSRAAFQESNVDLSIILRAVDYLPEPDS